MTEQEAFTKVYRHLLKQRRRSVCPMSGACLYRGPGGLKCAVGALIGDRDYTPHLEGIAICDLAGRLPTLQNLHVSFLEGLQTIHDNYKPSAWERRLRTFGHEWGLRIPKIRNVRKSVTSS
jgi:hypothetical protein